MARPTWHSYTQSAAQYKMFPVNCFSSCFLHCMCAQRALPCWRQVFKSLQTLLHFTCAHHTFYPHHMVTCCKLLYNYLRCLRRLLCYILAGTALPARHLRLHNLSHANLLGHRYAIKALATHLSAGLAASLAPSRRGPQRFLEGGWTASGLLLWSLSPLRPLGWLRLGASSSSVGQRHEAKVVATKMGMIQATAMTWLACQSCGQDGSNILCSLAIATDEGIVAIVALDIRCGQCKACQACRGFCAKGGSVTSWQGYAKNVRCWQHAARN